MTSRDRARIGAMLGLALLGLSAACAQATETPALGGYGIATGDGPTNAPSRGSIGRVSGADLGLGRWKDEGPWARSLDSKDCGLSPTASGCQTVNGRRVANFICPYGDVVVSIDRVAGRWSSTPTLDAPAIPSAAPWGVILSATSLDFRGYRQPNEILVDAAGNIEFPAPQPRAEQLFHNDQPPSAAWTSEVPKTHVYLDRDAISALGITTACKFAMPKIGFMRDLKAPEPN